MKVIKENATWKITSISNIVVKNGIVEIGFLASAKANSFCMIDDVMLVKNK